MAIEFKLNERKAIESVIWLIQRGQNNMYWVWKMLFAAEKYHLNKYGRPITGDTYMAMQRGTVPRWLYKGSGKAKEKYQGFSKNGVLLASERGYIRKFFSKTDIEALEFGYDEYKNLKTFDEVQDKNHKEMAWKKNWKKRGVRKEVPIPFEDFIDEAWLIEELKWKSHLMAI
ncbi:MAG: Panacea domain-containing protein [Fibromonadales bacterium]|nr:Panacea domain-containing protein [Fibromonadales bacterium]